MSVNVSEALVQQATTGTVDKPPFVKAIRESLPYTWGIVEKLAYSPHQEGEKWANYAVAPPDEQSRGQLLPMVRRNATCTAVKSHLKLAFQNCHNLATFRHDALNSATYLDFICVRSQILNQTPKLKDC